MSDQELRALILQMDTAASKVNNAVRVDASLAVLKPFLAQLWDDANAIGFAEGDAQASGDPYLIIIRNPFKDTP